MKDFTLLLFAVVVLVMIAMSGCSASVPQVSAEIAQPIAESQAPKPEAPAAPKAEEISKDFSEEDVVGFYFLKRFYEANSGKWINSQAIEVKRLQGIIVIDASHYETGKTDVRVMNNLKHGGQSGFGAILPDNLQVTFCGKAMNRTELFPIVDSRRMVVKGAFKKVGEGEGHEQVWQKLDICHIE